MPGTARRQRADGATRLSHTILYAGGFVLPDRSASAQRVRENANLFRSIGYDVVIMGKLPNGAHESSIDGFRCVDIQSPVEGRAFRPYALDAASVIAVAESIPRHRLAGIVAYNYPAPGLASLIRHAHAFKIPIVAEVTDWHGFDGPNLYVKMQKLWWSDRLYRVLAPRSRNIICATRKVARVYSACNVLTLPFAIDADAPKWSPALIARDASIRRFVYAGKPGAAIRKDRLDRIVEAFAMVHARGGVFELVMVGVTQGEFIEQLPGLAPEIARMGNSIKFLGRVPHADALREVASSDFTVLLRLRTKANEIGFPTKIVEAFGCGVPPVVNDTSDIGLYVRDGVNGILVRGTQTALLAEAIERAITTETSALEQMKQSCRQENPFRFTHFQQAARDFFNNLQ